MAALARRLARQATSFQTQRLLATASPTVFDRLCAPAGASTACFHLS